ncbi:FAD-binding oxidoreductase [Hamadaea tsunoensis]|uniref:FAD-binding oxidoreductase n=1 Tax=Hamadaea tsunoensis TaxID=53368 RepID=UPI00041703AE|nr:FAD-binding oxidoreductase [Hamadaea tsunoensis]
MITLPRTLAAVRAQESTVPIRATAGDGRWFTRPAGLRSVAEVLRSAALENRCVRPRGAGTKSSWFTAPSTVDITMSTGGLDTWRYEPGATTVTVGAGVPVQVAQVRLAAMGVRLPFDPPSPGATIGGVLATNERGPLALHYGEPVDQVRGAWGVRRGGRVVALGEPDLACAPAFPDSAEHHPDPADLRWLSGGALVDVTLPVHRLPAARRWVSHDVASPLEIFDLLAALADEGVSPAAVELDLPAHSPARFGHLGRLTVLIEGSVTSATDRAGTLADAFGHTADGFSDEAPEGWGRYPWRLGDLGLRMEGGGEALASAAYAIRDAAHIPLAVRGGIGAGFCHVAVPGNLPVDTMRAVIETAGDVLMARGGHVTVLTAPAALHGPLSAYLAC